MSLLSLSDRVLHNHLDADRFVKRGKPRWLRAQLPRGENYSRLIHLVRSHNLHTVCQEATCPNMGECWSAGVATLMILGDVCTRSCGFCHVKTGRPPTLDTDEPRRVADAVALMNLDYVVITSVNRDELPDGGAEIWAQTIRAIRGRCPNTQIEVLIPDFCGDWSALQLVLDAQPDVLAHNLETVPRLYPAVRPQAKYHRSIELLRRSKQQGFITKTGIMVGIGESDSEVLHLMRDVIDGTCIPNHQSSIINHQSRSAAEIRRSPAEADPIPHPPSAIRHRPSQCDLLTIGQYLQPSPGHLPVNRFVHPDTFAMYKQQGESLGFTHVESGPMVRSSYHADKQAKIAARASA